MATTSFKAHIGVMKASTDSDLIRRRGSAILPPIRNTLRNSQMQMNELDKTQAGFLDQDTPQIDIEKVPARFESRNRMNTHNATTKVDLSG